MYRSCLVVFAVCLGMAVPAAAQSSAPSVSIAGTIDSFDGKLLTVAATDGRTVAVTVPDEVPVGAVVDRTLADIKAGDYVGSAALKGADGKLHALEVHIFAPSQRGVGEGHRPMGPPNQTMTNATVAEVTASTGDGTLHLKYQDGEQTILVGPEARVVQFIVGDRSLLKPGAATRVFALKAADGSLTARFVQAEKDGIKPLM
ncbi:MAG: hypothetical protein P4L82_19165 [Ancalomicrobiaceae bacterium]|nr:hypothetical protein [Ancalomicrobiaceae bacterium]